MAGRFRHAPPVADTRWIRRERLHRRLLRRFDVPLVVVTAPAGYGKTSLLASVIGEHADDPERIDRWLQCDVADGDAEVLGAALSASIGYPVEAGTMVTAAHLADRLAAQAPAQMSVVLDDFHLVPDSSAGLRLVGELIAALPSNAHLVLSGRERPNLPLARRLVPGELEHLDRSDLAFDDEELVEVHADERGHRRAIAEADPASDPARWPALVALERQHGPVAPADFILEEVAGALGAVRRSALAAVACLHDIDDDVVRAASDRQLTAQQLFDGLPLVHRSPAGTYQLHQLWREALVPGDDVVGDAEVAAALMRVASQRRAANPVESAELSARAGDTEGVEAAAVFLAGRALMFTFTSELRRMSEVCERLLPSHPVTQLVRAALLVNTDEQASAEAFERAAMAARDAGDHSVEALALVHAANMRAVIDPARVPGWISERADELLAEGVTAVRLASVLLRSLAARVDGRPDDALKVLGELTAPRVPMETVMLSFGVSDLGRPELVPLPTDAAEARAVAVAGGGQAVAQAMWFRGLVSPEVAISVNRDHSETPNRAAHPMWWCRSTRCGPRWRSLQVMWPGLGSSPTQRSARPPRPHRTGSDASPISPMRPAHVSSSATRKQHVVSGGSSTSFPSASGRSDHTSTRWRRSTSSSPDRAPRSIAVSSDLRSRPSGTQRGRWSPSANTAIPSLHGSSRGTT